MTAAKLHKSPDETDGVWSRRLLQMRETDSGPKPGLRVWTPTPHPWWWRIKVIHIPNYLILYLE